MKSVLIMGAGLSSTALIQYLLKESSKYHWNVTVADNNLSLAQKKVGDYANGKAMQINVLNSDKRRKALSNADIVVSLLPADLHLEVAYDCLHMGKHLITASYVSPKMHELAINARRKGIIFMGELGLDPGIDHMSAMAIIDGLKTEGASIGRFHTYTGGLVAPESDDNPWHYKFSWNPRNVVLAGQGTAQYLDNGKFKYIPYHQLFERYEIVDIIGHGKYEMYANRDSLNYRKTYGLEGIPNLLRGTLRHLGFCEAWNALVRIGLTDNSYPILDSGTLSYREMLDAYLDENNGNTVEERVAATLGVDLDSEIIYKLKWMGLFEDRKIRLRAATPARILEKLLKRKWNLRKYDKDMIVMQHEFDYTLEEKTYQLFSTMVLKGNDNSDTAMSKLVGLPLGIFVKNVLLGNITQVGEAHIPVRKEIYGPVMEELKKYGVEFTEEKRMVSMPEV